jgi:HSP20 family protein
MENRQFRCGPSGWRRHGFYQAPPVNISETEREYILHVYAPSLVKENISITTHNDVLSIGYKAEKDDSSPHFTRKEYRVEEIDRSFDLKGKVDVDRIKASYQEGILKVELPKTEGAKRPSQEVPVD